MIPTSADWKAAVLNPDVSRICKARAFISMGTPLIEETAIIYANDCQFPDGLSQLQNITTAPSGMYYAIDAVSSLDGNYVLCDPDSGDEVGYVFNNVSGSNGAFSEPYPTIVISYNSTQNAISELTVYFDTVRGEYATDFAVDFIDANGDSLGVWRFTGNTSTGKKYTAADASSDTAGAVVTGAKSINFIIYSWSIGGNTARIIEIGNATQLTFTDADRIMSMTVNEEINDVNINTKSVYSSKLTIEFDNSDNYFTVDNPDSPFHDVKPERKNILVEFGMQLDPDDADSVEWVSGGSYFIESLRANDGEPTATITAYDIIKNFELHKYTPTLTAGTHDLQDICNDVLESLPYSLATTFDTVIADHDYSTAGAPEQAQWDENVTVRAALSDLTECFVGYVRRSRKNNQIEFRSSLNSSVDGSGYPIDFITGITGTYTAADPYEIDPNATFLPLTDETSEETWGNRVTAYYKDSNGSDQFKRWQYTQSVTDNGLKNVDLHNIRVLKDKSAGDSNDAYMANCISRAFNNIYRPTQKVKRFSYRGDPALEAGDAVKVYDRQEVACQGCVISHTITFNGGFSGEITLRGI